MGPHHCSLHILTGDMCSLNSTLSHWYKLFIIIYKSDQINAIYTIICILCKICAGNSKTNSGPELLLKKQIRKMLR